MSEADRDSWSQELYHVWRFEAAKQAARAEHYGTRLAHAERALRLMLAGKPAKNEIAAWIEATKEAA